MSELNLTLTVGEFSSPDDCDHATLIGIVRRALEASPEFTQRYEGRLVGLVVPITESMNSDSYRSAWRIG